MLTLAIFHNNNIKKATKPKYELEGDLGVRNHPQEFKKKRRLITSYELGK